MKRKQLVTIIIAALSCVGISPIQCIAIDDTVNTETNTSFVAGDANGDGAFSVSDVVLFQKWLLADPNTELPNWKAVDYNHDNKLDVFDLTLMKRALIQNSRVLFARKDQFYAIVGKTFVYENEGMGGEFTISFNEDGTYVYYEGDLSSYIGSGSWTINADVVILTEEIKGSIIRLKIQDGALTYIDDGSQNFYYIKVKDGDKFYLCEQNDNINEPTLDGKTFVYENEGMGGEFTISFNEDGTYVYYEGDLSSYIGSGTWKIFDDTAILTENLNNAIIRLKIQDNTLIYSAEDSNNFYYIKVKDGERFTLSE